MFDLKKELVNYETFFNSKVFEEDYCYSGELGNFYSKEKTIFRVWNPIAYQVTVRVYHNDGYITKDDLAFEKLMNKVGNGVWELELKSDLKNMYYTYAYSFDNIQKQNNSDIEDNVNYIYIEDKNEVIVEVADIYGKASGTNGLRTMIVDLEETNPDGWNNDKKPKFNKFTDAIIYELHVRDFSSDINSGIKNNKQYLAFTENNTKNEYGDATGIEHLKELGVTHIHLLPIQDFGSVDEGDKEKKEYNWGYDPYNYNVPEGSYASAAADGKVRIKELKTAIKAIHDAGMRVVLDVVYNHTYDTRESLFDKTIPNYYHRTLNGKYTNGSGCGNETASDRAMFRKYMIDSLVYWVKEYHIDGFRFDLMAVHDIETMNQIRMAMDEIDKSILLYGEGWVGGKSKLSYEKAAFKNNAKKMENIAMFNDDGRDAIKGSVFIADNTGFATGAMYLSNSIIKDRKELMNNIKFMLAGSGIHEQVKTNNKEKIGERVYSWADSPVQVINYVSAHDNMTLWDKIQVSHKEESRETLIKMNKLSMSIVMLSQGIPFIHAGDEFLRSKVNSKCKLGFDDNSYRSGDEVNSIKWNDKTKNKEVFNYYKGLIEFRKNNDLLKMTERKEINDRVEFEEIDEGVILYKIKDNVGKVKMITAFNGMNRDYTLELPIGITWNVYIDEKSAGNSIIRKVKDKIVVKSLSTVSVLDS